MFRKTEITADGTSIMVVCYTMTGSVWVKYIPKTKRFSKSEIDAAMAYAAGWLKEAKRSND
jgi:hypothetical protein